MRQFFIDIENFGTVLNLGKVGENKAKQIIINLASWKEKIDDSGATYKIYYTRPDQESYEVAFEQEESLLKWTIMREDLIRAGSGTVAVMMVDENEQIIISATCICCVHPGVNGQLVDDGYEEFYTQELVNKIKDLEERVSQLEESTGGGSKIQEIENDIKDIKSRLEECEKNDPKIEELTTNYSQLETRVAAVEKAIQEIEELRQKFSDEKGRVDTLSAAQSRLEGELTSLQENYNILSTDCNGLQEDYNDLDDAVGNLQSSYTTLSSDYSTMNERMATLEQLGTTISALQAEVERIAGLLGDDMSGLIHQVSENTNNIATLMEG